MGEKLTRRGLFRRVGQAAAVAPVAAILPEGVEAEEAEYIFQSDTLGSVSKYMLVSATLVSTPMVQIWDDDD